jgi:ABC-type ATPase with predicted acetyltransferase domain
VQDFDIVRESEPVDSFRVQSVVGRYELQSKKIVERFTGSIALPNKWSVGLIVGASGTGKTTILKELFGDYIAQNHKFTATAVVDDMPESVSMTEICKTLNAVGFSSPPSWLKPYHVLSNGEKMRVELARALLEAPNMFAFDEFTSVVDRNVAKIGSYAMQKAIRRTDKQFIACTCHYDVEEWLQPDWVFCTNSMRLKKKLPTADRQSESKSLKQKQESKSYGISLLVTTI